MTIKGRNVLKSFEPVVICSRQTRSRLCIDKLFVKPFCEIATYLAHLLQLHKFVGISNTPVRFYFSASHPGFSLKIPRHLLCVKAQSYQIGTKLLECWETMPTQTPQWTEFLSCPVCYNVFNERLHRFVLNVIVTLLRCAYFMFYSKFVLLLPTER